MWNNVPINGWPQIKGLDNVSEIPDMIEDISALETTVGDSSGGLVKDVSDLKTTVGSEDSGLVKDVSDLKTTVGDSNSGLVKDVNTLTAKMIKSDTFSGTTSAAGLLQIYSDADRAVLACLVSTGDKICEVYNRNTSSDVFARVLYEDGTVAASVATSGIYYYIDIPTAAQQTREEDQEPADDTKTATIKRSKKS